MFVCVQGTNADESSALTEFDIDNNPREWNGRQLQSGDKQFFYFRPGDDPPHFDPNANQYIVAPKGMAQVLYEREKYVKGMTANGEKDSYMPENPDTW